MILYKKNLNMIEKENKKYQTIIINDTKNENLREKLKNILPLFTENKNKKSKDFEKAIKKLKNDKDYEFKTC